MRRFFRRAGHCNRFPKGSAFTRRGKQRTEVRACSSAVHSGFFEKLDRDFTELCRGTPLSLEHRRGAKYIQSCKAVYRCLKSGTGWREKDLRYISQFRHPLYLLTDFVEDSGYTADAALLQRILGGVRSGQLDIGKYRLGDSGEKAA